MIHNEAGVVIPGYIPYTVVDVDEYASQDYGLVKNVSYDKDTQEYTWTVDINYYEATISPDFEVIFYDELPEGMELVSKEQDFWPYGWYNVSIEAGYSAQINIETVDGIIGPININQEIRDTNWGAGPDGISETHYVITYVTKATSEAYALAAENGGSIRVENVAYTYDEEHPNDKKRSSETARIDVDAIEKEDEGVRNENGKDYVDYSILANKDGYILNDGNDLTILDDLPEDVYLDVNSVKVLDEKGEDVAKRVSYDSAANRLIIVIPDQTKVTVTYSVIATTYGTNTYTNRVTLRGKYDFEDKTEKEHEFVEESAGLYGLQASFEIKKYDKEDITTGLAGAEFEIYQGGAGSVEITNQLAPYSEEDLEEALYAKIGVSDHVSWKIVGFTERPITWWPEFNEYTYEIEYSIDKLLGKGTSTEEGAVKFADLDFSTVYYWKETKAPDTYLLTDDSKHYFVLYSISDANPPYTKKDAAQKTIEKYPELDISLLVDDFTWYVSNENANLTITKTVQGENIDTNQKFDFTITLTDEVGAPISATFHTEDQNGNAGSVTFGENGKSVISLGADESLTIIGMATSWKYLVEEEVYEDQGYRTEENTYRGDFSEDVEITFVNSKKTETAEEYISAAVTKVNDLDEKLPGVTFTLYSDSECTNQIVSYTTDSEGKLEIDPENLTDYLPAPGRSISLYLKETEVPKGYDLSDTVYPVTISAIVGEETLDDGVFKTTTTYVAQIDAMGEKEIINNRRTDEAREDSDVTLTKKDQDGERLGGASFGIYDNNAGTGDALENFTAGEAKISTDDPALASVLPAAGSSVTLYVIETKAPAGYEKDDSAHELVISASEDTAYDSEKNAYITTTTYTITIDDKSSIEVTNKQKTGEESAHSDVTLMKKDQDGEKLDGATFGIYDNNGGTGEALKTIIAGEAKISTDDPDLASVLPVAGSSVKLYVIETEAPAGYEKDDTAHELLISASEDTAYNSEKDAYITTTTYTITIDGGSNAVVTNTKKTGEARVDNQITLTKKDQDGEKLDGATFGIYDNNAGTGDALKTFTAGEAKISTDDPDLASVLPAAGSSVKLYVIETVAPAGYDKDDTARELLIRASEDTAYDSEKDAYITTTTYTITIDGGSDAVATNKQKTGEESVHSDVTLTKKDQDGEELDGATFGIFDNNAGTGDALKTFTAGTATISTEDAELAGKLPAVDANVTLYVIETRAPAGYEKDDTAHPLLISTSVTTAYDPAQDRFITTTTYSMTIDGKSSTDVVNTQKVEDKFVHASVQVNKVNENEEELSGATFTLYKEDKETHIKTYEGGKFIINTEDSDLADLLPTENNGTVTLYLQETEAPEGYNGDTTYYPVVIKTTKTEPTYDATEDKYITTTTYSITIDGGTSKTVKNTLKTGQLSINKKILIDNTENITNADKEFYVKVYRVIDGTTYYVTSDNGLLSKDETKAKIFRITTSEGQEITGLPIGIYTVTEVDGSGHPISQTNFAATIGTTSFLFDLSKTSVTAEVKENSKTESEIINAYTSGRYCIAVTKQWLSNGKIADGIDDLTLNVKLQRKLHGEGDDKYKDVPAINVGTSETTVSGAVITLNKANNWSAVAVGMDQMNGQDVRYEYRWVEMSGTAELMTGNVLTIGSSAWKVGEPEKIQYTVKDGTSLVYLTKLTNSKVDVEIPVQKVVNGNYTGNEDFTVTLTEGEGNPQKIGNNNMSVSATSLTLKQNETKSFEIANITIPGNYTFTVKETAGSTLGMYYDTADHIVTFTVAPDLTVIGLNNGKTGVQTITNKYSEVVYAPTVKKAVDGANAPLSVYTFTLKDISTDKTGETIGATTASVTGAGTATFGGITYKKAGTYVYEITENVPADADKIPGMTYVSGNGKVTLTVVIQSEDGVLSLESATYAGGDGAGDTITNKYETGNLTISKDVSSSITSDQSILFGFDVELKYNDELITGTYNDISFENGVAKNWLKAGQSITITGIPYGTTYKVTEIADGRFETKVGTEEKYVAEGPINSANVTVSYTNTRKTSSLTISKALVSEVAADAGRVFNFTIELSEAVSGEFAISGTTEKVTFTNGTGTVSITGEGSKTIEGLPTGVTYEIAEANVVNLTPDVAVKTGTLSENKTETFTNTRETGSLTIKKTVVSSNAADKALDWNFIVTLIGVNAGEKTYSGVKFTNGVSEAITLKHNGSKTIEGLPAGVTYSVAETQTNTNNFVTTSVGETGTIGATGTSTAAFTNTKSEGGLIVSKKVVSAITADHNKTFTITVTLDDDKITGTYGDATFTAGVAALEGMKDGDVKVIEGLPIGVGYTVTETLTGEDGNIYTVGYTGATGKIEEKKTKAALVTNTRKTAELTISKTVASTIESD